jgi:hypothetical protein
MKTLFKKLLRGIKKICQAIGRAFIFIVLKIIDQRVQERLDAIDKVKTKVKYFNPTITEGFFGKKVTWTMRDKPLTDDEMNNL